MEINYACSLGPNCHSTQILKIANFRKFASPFDWIYSNCNLIIHCLKEDFKTFLDKSYYKGITHKQCGHSYYHKQLFEHHNPLENEKDYNYFVNGANNFKDLIRREEHKLFTMIFTNMNEIDEDIKENVIKFNGEFSKYAINYTLLIILNVANKQSNYHNFTYNENVHFLELHTLSDSCGFEFKNDEDNVYLNNVIKSSYNFNIK